MKPPYPALCLRDFPPVTVLCCGAVGVIGGLLAGSLLGRSGSLFRITPREATVTSRWTISRHGGTR